MRLTSFCSFLFLFAPDYRLFSQIMWRRAVRPFATPTLFRLIFTVFAPFCFLVWPLVRAEPSSASRSWNDFVHSNVNVNQKGLGRTYYSRVRTDIKMFFPRTSKDQIPGFSRTRCIHKHELHEVKKVHIQNQLSVYLHYSKEADMQYLRLYYCI